MTEAERMDQSSWSDISTTHWRCVALARQSTSQMWLVLQPATSVSSPTLSSYRMQKRRVLFIWPSSASLTTFIHWDLPRGYTSYPSYSWCFAEICPRWTLSTTRSSCVMRRKSSSSRKRTNQLQSSKQRWRQRLRGSAERSTRRSWLSIAAKGKAQRSSREWAIS